MSLSHRIRYTWRPLAQQIRIQHRCFSQFPRRLNESPSATPPNDEQQPPSPKAPVQNKIWAFVIGAGAALAYAAYKRSRAPQQTPVSIDGFTKYTLVEKDDVSSTCSIFTIAPLTGQKSAVNEKEHLRSILSIQIKQPQLQIARSYTILPPIPGQANDAIRLLIRREAKGEVSGYLHDVPVGSDIEVRGPHVDISFPSDTTNVIFLAGGTGIAPALKAAALLRDSANMHVLWASRKNEDCAGGVSDTVSNNAVANASNAIFSKAKAMFGQSVEDETTSEKNTLVLLLDILKLQQGANDATPKSLTVDYFVDEKQTYIRPSSVSKLVTSLRTSENATPSTNLIIVSGPDGFIYHWAGAKEWVNGHQEQGALGGVLSKLDLRGWQVIKL